MEIGKKKEGKPEFVSLGFGCIKKTFAQDVFLRAKF